MPLSGGEEERVLDQPVAWFNWALTPGGIYFLNEADAQKPAIEFFDFATREITPIHSLEKPASDLGVWPSLRMANTFSMAKTDADDSYNMLVNNYR